MSNPQKFMLKRTTLKKILLHIRDKVNQHLKNRKRILHLSYRQKIMLANDFGTLIYLSDSEDVVIIVTSKGKSIKPRSRHIYTCANQISLADPEYIVKITKIVKQALMV